MDAGFFQWSAHLAEALQGYNDVVLINECDWGVKLKQRTFLQCLGPSARWFAGALDSRPTSIEGARALFLHVTHPTDWMRILPRPQPAYAERVLLVDPKHGISAAAAKQSLHRHWHKESA
ncbi:hypothetical protein [Cupriavidus taiwanensis]|uniref:hypothetical protein n=1 Tax=Cupriavidus taiwanensis TaxID=164546 RepID=UPI0011C020BD|nr:hypothetical protein [Cupriavidus taiwanensis]